APHRGGWAPRTASRVAVRRRRNRDPPLPTAEFAAALCRHAACSETSVASSDRAARMLFREHPDVMRRLVAATAPDVLDAREVLLPEDFDDPSLSLPPPIEADFVARHG